MADALVKLTYQEDPDMLEWIDQTVEQINLHRFADYRGRRLVSRADVIRWLVRIGRKRAAQMVTQDRSAEI